MLAFLGLYVPLMLYLYGRQRRWSAALGWSMLVGGVAALGAGAGDAFPWGGLAFLSLSALGGLLVAMDIVGQRNKRIRRG